VRTLRLVLVLALAALGGAPVVAGPKVDPKAEAKAKEKIVETALAAAEALAAVGANTEAVQALEEARAAGADGAEVDARRAKLGAEPASVPDGPARWAKVAAELAKQYEKLAGLAHEPADAPRFEGYLFKAAELEPSKGRLAKLFTNVKQAAGNKGQADVAGRMLVKLRELDVDGAAAGKYDALEVELASGDVALIRGAKHPMVGWLSLPSGWTKKGPYEVLVAVEGAGSNFLGAARGFRGGRGSRKFLVLAPCSLSNTNKLEPATYSFYDPALLKQWDGRRVEFDLAGLDALLEVLRARFGAAEKVAITGFSGGGNLCYSLTMRHPEKVWAAAPACANFQPGLASGAKPVEGGGPPVHVLTGEKDEHRDHVFGTPPGIEGQSDWAIKSFETLGFKNVKRTMLPGVGHSSCVKEVWEFLDQVLAAR
jgi:dienelactone hydrolase